MSNLTFDHGLLKAHTPEPLERHAVVVFKRVGEAGETLHSIIVPSVAPVKPRLALPFRRRSKYLAYAVDTELERHLDFSESMRLQDDVSEIRVVFHLAYAVSDAATLARTRNSDPLRRVRDQVRSVIQREVEQLPRDAVWKTFPQHARAIVDGCMKDLSAFAAQYGLGVRELRLTIRLPKAIGTDRRALDDLIDEKLVGSGFAAVVGGYLGLRLAELIKPGPDMGQLPKESLAPALKDGFGERLSAVSSLALPERGRGGSVLLGGSAPRYVQPGETILVQVAAYTAEFEQQVRQVLERDAQPEEVRLGEPTTCQWAAGATVSVRCRANRLVVPTPIQRFIWDGRWRTVSFDIDVPQGARYNSTVIVLDVFIHDGDDVVQVATMRMLVRFSWGTERHQQRRWVHSRAARKAFASYASQDRADVLARVSSIARSTGMDIFVDRTSLRMGEEWEPALLAHIAESERFLLFWSEFAAQSAWVRREMDEAIAAHGEDVMELHLLRHVPSESIPERLRKFHFDDPYLLARDADLHRKHVASPPDG